MAAEAREDDRVGRDGHRWRIGSRNLPPRVPGRRRKRGEAGAPTAEPARPPRPYSNTSPTGTVRTVDGDRPSGKRWMSASSAATSSGTGDA